MRYVALSAFALLVATPAFAQDAGKQPFSGFHAEALVGYDTVDDGTDSEDGVTFGGAFGYDFRASSLVFGVEGEITTATTRACTDDNKTVCAESGRDLYAGARVGTPVSENVMVYAKAGYTNGRIVGTYLNQAQVREDLDGVRGGVGVELARGSLLLRTEYRYSNYEQGVTRHQGVVGLGVRF